MAGLLNLLCNQSSEKVKFAPDMRRRTLRVTKRRKEILEAVEQIVVDTPAMRNLVVLSSPEGLQ